MFLGVARLLISDVLIERQGDETAAGVKEALNGGKCCHILYIHFQPVHLGFLKTEFANH